MKNFLIKNIKFFIPILFLLIYLLVSYFHSVFEEWDGVIQYFQGNEILGGKGYTNWGAHYWPPLYSLLTGLLSKIINGFFAAKLVSITASVFTLIVIYPLVLEISNNKKIAVFSQFVIAINPYYFISSIQAENHMLDTFFFVTAFLFLIRSIKRPEIKANIIFMAVFSAMATLSRYTSYALVPLIFIAFIFFIDKKYLIRNFLFFIAIFTLLNLPWYYYNFLKNGSPLHTWQYLNIGSYIYPGGISKWQWLGQKEYYSVLQIFTNYPKEYIRNFLNNFIDSIVIVVMSIKIIPVLCLPVIITHWKRFIVRSSINYLKNPFFILSILGFLCFLTLVCQAFVFREVFLSWNVLFSILFLSTVINIIDLRQIRSSAFRIITVLIFFNLLYTGFHLYKYLKVEDDYGQLSDYKEISSLLKRQDNIEDSYIMCLHPGRSYYSNAKYIMFPEFFTGDVISLVKYEGLPEKVKLTQPKYPFIDSNEIHADFLIFDKPAAKKLPQFCFLFNENDSQIPGNFKLLYQSKNTVVYQIQN